MMELTKLRLHIYMPLLPEGGDISMTANSFCKMQASNFTKWCNMLPYNHTLLAFESLKFH